MTVYEKITESQAGFREGYSTIDNVFILYAVISRYFNTKGKYLYVAFVDFQKAFDSVNRSILYKMLQTNGISGKLLNSIKAIYLSVKARVRTASGYTDTFQCPVGLRQGCKLSPILFIMFINDIEQVFRDSGVRGIQLFPDITELFLLMFADDLALLSDTVVGLQKQLNTLRTFCNQNKLTVNVEKTKVVVFKKGGRIAANEKWYYAANRLEVVS